MRISRHRKGFTLVEIMIVIAIIALLAAIAVPNFIQARNSARSGLCINNLRLIDSAKEQWAVETNAVTGDAVADTDISPYMKGEDMPQCPGTTAAYTIGDVGDFPTCDLSGANPGENPKSHRLD